MLPDMTKHWSRMYSIVCLCVQLAARESSVEKMWDAGIVEPANNVIAYNLFLGQNDERYGVQAFWQAQGKTTETHSDTESPLCRCLLLICMLNSIIHNNVNKCAQVACATAQHALVDDATTEAEVRIAMTASQTHSVCRLECHLHLLS